MESLERRSRSLERRSRSHIALWESCKRGSARGGRRRRAQRSLGQHRSPLHAPASPAARLQAVPAPCLAPILQPASRAAAARDSAWTCPPSTPGTPCWNTALTRAGKRLPRNTRPWPDPGVLHPRGSAESVPQAADKEGETLRSRCEIQSGAEHLETPLKSMEKGSARASGGSTGEGSGEVQQYGAPELQRSRCSLPRPRHSTRRRLCPAGGRWGRDGYRRWRCRPQYSVTYCLCKNNECYHGKLLLH